MSVERLIQRAMQARLENRIPDAERDLVVAVELCRAEDNRGALADALTQLGRIKRDLHDLESARQLYLEAVEILRNGNDMLKLAHTVRHLGDVYRHEQRLDLAEDCYTEVIQIYRIDADTKSLDLANALRGLAILKTNAREVKEARSLWEEAMNLYQHVGVSERVDESKRRIALIDNSGQA